MDLRSLRYESGLTQFAVASRSGLDRTRVSLAENGHVQLTEEEKRAVRDVLIKAIQRRVSELEEVLASVKKAGVA